MGLSTHKCSPIGSERTLLHTKRAWVLCGLFSGLGFGIALTLFSICMYLLSNSKRRPHVKSQRKMLRMYITWVIFLETICTAIVMYITIDSLIDQTCPEGQLPMDPYFGYSDVVYLLSNWSADFLLIWRCKVIFSNSGISQYVYLGIPLALVAASIGVGTTLTVFSCLYGRTPKVTMFLVIYSIISLCINLVVTTMIVIRLYLHHRKSRNVLGSHRSPYATVMSVLIESALLVIVLDLVFVVFLGTRNSYAMTFFIIWVQSQPIATMLIIFRVAQGKTWSGSGEQSMSMDNSPSNAHPIMLVSTETAIHVQRDRDRDNDKRSTTKQDFES